MSENEVIEEIEQLDSNQRAWKIERYIDYTMLIYEDNLNFIPDAAVTSIILEETDFESYCKLREIIKKSTTLQIWNKINEAITIINDMILETPIEPDGFTN